LMIDEFFTITPSALTMERQTIRIQLNREFNNI